MSKKNFTQFRGYAPYYYNQIQAWNGSTFPSTVKNFSATYSFWERSLFQRTCSIIDFNLPENWDGPVRDFFYYCLFRFGFLCIFENKEYGYTFQPANLHGFDLYYQPTKAVVSNPKLSYTFVIGKEGYGGCELLKLTPDYMGIWDIISYYAEKLATLDPAINMSIINSKLAYVLGAKTKAGAEALKKVMDRINNGESTIIVDSLLKNDPQSKDNPFTEFERTNLKNSYITDQLLEDFATIMAQFDSEIGIKNMGFNNKKERMNTDEVNIKQDDAISRATVWKNSLQSSLDIVNRHYGSKYGDITFKFRFEEEQEDKVEEVSEDVRIQDNINRA